MSAQCCAGQVSGARRRAGATTHRAMGLRGFSGCAPRLAAEREAAGGLLRADPEPPGLDRASGLNAALGGQGNPVPRTGGKGHGEAERLPRGPLSVLKNFAEGGAGRTRAEDPQCSRSVSTPPGRECVVLSSVALQALPVRCTQERRGIGQLLLSQALNKTRGRWPKQVALSISQG
ncbi:hypothetical protein PAL_GLEAN10024939 [Pteropus alecto]|uniref:Uncharacterized protein n=1 Tax=Pteropus alecto TaxID=9402 RepID=L5KJH9_PTEAL|nr:hypothetical protein PAL_GLEAN10024939 [Pteropus alecto]